MTRKAILLILFLASMAGRAWAIVPAQETAEASSMVAPDFEAAVSSPAGVPALKDPSDPGLTDRSMGGCGPGFPACYASCQGLQWHQFLQCVNNCTVIHC